MKNFYVVEFNATNTQDGWSRMEFTSITKALGFVSLMVKRGCHCQIFKGVTAWKHNAPFNSQFLGAQRPQAGQDY